ncbi:MAG: hybrid sensor histidine kinase/response regulator [Deltaproteobacteria bacterium]|nr:MAG: hybrid sensor histidine kinase/response regulator [Deltaproteobacteria bacterium]
MAGASGSSRWKARGRASTSASRAEIGDAVGTVALMVEDNQSHVELMSDELETELEDWSLEVANNLAEARRRIAARPYDLFVFDFKLPDGDGIELLREVRAAGIDTPTIFVTTAASAKLAVEAMKLGADDYLVKEEGYLTALPYVVREVLNRRRLADERRALEDRLQRAERAATLGYLASGLAHHINNPLATIRTFLQLLPDHVEDPEFRSKYLAMALAESERIRDLVKDIIRTTTVPAEGREIRDLGDILADADNAIAADLKKKNITVEKRVPASVPLLRVHGEAATCLVVSLLQNAVRFSPEGSTVELDVRVDAPAERVSIVVRDHGPGIPPEDRDKIFEPFFTTAVDGLGMGLFVASRIADLQNVGLSFRNCEPHGAAFTISIPIADDAPAKAPAAD